MDYGNGVDCLKRSKTAFYAVASIVALMYLATLVAVSVGWAEANSADVPSVDSKYKAIWQYYTDGECTLATGTPLGPCESPEQKLY